MEGLARLRASRRAYRAHVTRIFGKVEETLASQIDELATTYLTTAISQLEKKKEQIVKLDEQIFELIEDSSELEDAIMDSEELQDSIVEKVNELHKRVEIFQRPCHTTTTSQPVEISEATPPLQEPDRENVSDITSTLPLSLCDTTVTTVSSNIPNLMYCS